MSEKPGIITRVFRGALLAIVFLIVFAVVIRILVGPTGKSSKSGSRTAAAKPAEELPSLGASAVQLVSDYEANEVAADGKYKGQWIEVSGVVDSIGKDVMGTPYVSLKSDNAVRKVQCLFGDDDQSELSSLSKGAEIRIVGKCNGLMMNVLLEKCRIAK